MNGKEKKHSILKYFQKSTLRATFLNAGIGMPPHFVNGRLHPGFEAGLQKSFTDHPARAHGIYTIQLGYFSQRSLQRAWYLKPGAGFSLQLHKKIALTPKFNLSLMAVQQINPEYKLNDQHQYVQVNSMRIQWMPSLGLETTVLLAQSARLQYRLLAGYEFGLQLPFSAISAILPVNQLFAGVAISMFKK
jgi:hypothetical protein